MDTAAWVTQFKSIEHVYANLLRRSASLFLAQGSIPAAADLLAVVTLLVPDNLPEAASNDKWLPFPQEIYSR